jgi:hypothetical protein
MTRLARLVGDVAPVSLEELERRAALQRRVDRKHLVTWEQLGRLVRALAGDHQVLEIDGRRAFRYESVYFDTPDLRSFRDHVEGRAPRFKIRSRLYADSGVTSFEIKVKLPDGETTKESLEQGAADHGRLTATARGFLVDQLGRLLDVHQLPPLRPTLITRFERATLASRSSAERITCDAALELARPDGRAVRLAGDHVVVETKSEDGDQRVDRLLADAGLAPVSLSKYRTGIGLLVRDDPDPDAPVARELWSPARSAIATVSSG